jgi:hypothetical protein
LRKIVFMEFERRRLNAWLNGGKEERETQKDL